jgi:nicotinamidase-related amidase
MKCATIHALIFGLLCATGAAAHAQDVIQEWNQIKPAPAPALKTVKIDAAKTAFLVMDFDSKNCTANKRARCVPAVPKVAALLSQARAKGVLVINFFNSNMTRDDIVPALKPAAGEMVEQGAPDKFYGSDLEKTLKAHNIDTLLLAGSSANGTVLATALGGAERKFKLVVPVDVIPADGAWQEQFSSWEIVNGPGMRGLVTLTRSDMVSF